MQFAIDFTVILKSFGSVNYYNGWICPKATKIDMGVLFFSLESDPYALLSHSHSVHHVSQNNKTYHYTVGYAYEATDQT